MQTQFLIIKIDSKLALQTGVHKSNNNLYKQHVAHKYITYRLR